MFGFVSAAAPAFSRNRSAAAPRAAPRRKAEREMRMLDGAAPIPAREGEKHVCALLVAAPAQNPLALPTPSVRLQMAPQAIEKAQNVPGIGARFAALPRDEPAPSPAFADALG